MVSIGIKTPQERLNYRELREMWVAADQLPQVDHLWLYDHFHAQGDERKSAPCLEAWASLAALAESTRSATLGILVSSVTHRPTAVLAAMSATVHEISGGRLELGLGAGWDVAEHEAWGIPLPAPAERIALLDETCKALRLLFQGGPVSFEGRHVQLHGAQIVSSALAMPSLVIGGTGPRMLGVVARHADVWNIAGRNVPYLKVKHEILRAQCEAIGRPIEEITVSAQVHAPVDSVDITAAWCARAVRSGAHHLVLELDRVATGAEIERLVEGVSRAIDRLPSVSTR